MSPRLMALVIAAVLVPGCGDDALPPRGPAVVTVVQDDAEMLHRTPERIGATLDDLRSLGVDWIRITAQWRAIQPEAGVPPNWAPLDQAVRMAGERGLRVALDIAFGPPEWATLEGDFADYVTAVAERYPQAVAFTVWNEPNHPVFLDPQWKRAEGGFVPAAPHTYRAMLREAVPRIRAAAPDALVLIGATSSLGEERGTDPDDRMSPLRFVRELACVDARLQPLDVADCRGDFAPLPGDGFSHHPYSGELPPWESDTDDPGSVRLADLGRLRDLLDRLHAAGRIEEDLPLYLTEYGYQTNPPDPTWNVTPAEQARWLSEAEEIARAEPSVRSVAHFLHRDLPKRPGTTNPWGDFQTGLLYESGEPKPAHEALALPLVAHRVAAGRVRFWGLVRPGQGPADARVQAQRDGGWETLFAVRTDAEGVFERTVDTDPAATFRLVAGSRTGAPLAGAR
ncbi:MAG: cellulase family glycosylhydrolase [Solirubrobacteraceae bacterium]